MQQTTIEWIIIQFPFGKPAKITIDLGLTKCKISHEWVNTYCYYPNTNWLRYANKINLSNSGQKISNTMWQASHIAGFDKGNNSIFIYLKLQVGNLSNSPFQYIAFSFDPMRWMPKKTNINCFLCLIKV